MTLKEKLLINFFEKLMEDTFDDLYSVDTDYDGFIKKKFILCIYAVLK